MQIAIIIAISIVSLKIVYDLEKKIKVLKFENYCLKKVMVQEGLIPENFLKEK